MPEMATHEIQVYETLFLVHMLDQITADQIIFILGIMLAHFHRLVRIILFSDIMLKSQIQLVVMF